MIEYISTLSKRTFLSNAELRDSLFYHAHTHEISGLKHNNLPVCPMKDSHGVHSTLFKFSLHFVYIFITA